MYSAESNVLSFRHKKFYWLYSSTYDFGLLQDNPKSVGFKSISLAIKSTLNPVYPVLLGPEPFRLDQTPAKILIRYLQCFNVTLF